jgi:arsenate reductase
MLRKVLFLCTGNSARSQMGETLLRKHAGHIFQVFSAGTDPKQEVFPPVVQVMKEIGIDISGHKPKGIDQLPKQERFGKVIIVCADADKKCPTIFGPDDKIFWHFDDPARARGTPDEVLAVCRQVRDQIDKRILNIPILTNRPVTS